MDYIAKKMFKCYNCRNIYTDIEMTTDFCPLCKIDSLTAWRIGCPICDKNMGMLTDIDTLKIGWICCNNHKKIKIYLDK